MRGGSVIEEARVMKLLLPTQNKERSLLKAAHYGLYLPESLEACLYFRNTEVLDIDWLFRSASSIIITLNNSQLGSFDWTKDVACFP